jgi:hypothetical protein
MICHNTESCFDNFYKIIDGVYESDPKRDVYKNLLDKTKAWLVKALEQKGYDNHTFTYLEQQDPRSPITESKSSKNYQAIIQSSLENNYLASEVLKSAAKTFTKCFEILDTLSQVPQNTIHLLEITNLQNEIVKSSKFWKTVADYTVDLSGPASVLDMSGRNSIEQFERFTRNFRNSKNFDIRDFKLWTCIVEENEALKGQLGELRSKWDGRAIFEDDAEKLGRTVIGRGKEFYWLEGKCHKLEQENAELKRYIKDRVRS